jgi:ribose-phosphate pyrophosphokinase
LINTLKVFAGTSSPELTKSICDYLGVKLGQAKVETFPDGEKFIKLEEDVRGKDCFVVQSTCVPVDENLMELLIFLDCFRRASARRITAVIPYFGYARQDRKDEGRVPITAKLVANMITVAGADRVLSIDLHAAQLQGFFDIPVDHLMAGPVLVEYFKSKKISDLTIVSPDVGNMKIAARYAAALGGDLAIIHKKRISGSEVECSEIIGDVEGRNVLMCDDMISTAGTMCSAAKLVKERGASSIIVGATHGVFAESAVEKINAAPFDEIIVTDTIPQTKSGEIENMKVLTIAKLLGEAIKRTHRNKSISSMFDQGY